MGYLQDTDLTENRLLSKVSFNHAVFIVQLPVCYFKSV